MRIMLAPRSTRRGDVLFDERVHHLQPDADRQGQQPLAQVLGQLGHSHAHRLRHGQPARTLSSFWYILAHGGPFPRGVLGRSPEYLPCGRAQVRDRHPNFHEVRDNLLLGLMDMRGVPLPYFFVLVRSGSVGDHEIPQVGGVCDQVIPHPAIT